MYKVKSNEEIEFWESFEPKRTSLQATRSKNFMSELRETDFSHSNKTCNLQGMIFGVENRNRIDTGVTAYETP